MAKGEIAHYEKFLILPQYFQESSATEPQKAIVCGKVLNIAYSRIKFLQCVCLTSVRHVLTVCIRWLILNPDFEISWK